MSAGFVHTQVPENGSALLADLLEFFCLGLLDYICLSGKSRDGNGFANF